MVLQKPPVVQAQMLIRKPASAVFQSFVDPSITSKFWFSRGSARLEQGKTVEWFWDMYGVSAQVAVKAIEQDRRILIEWPSRVEWTFTPHSDGTTMVRISVSGFTGSDDEIVAQAVDSMGGFSLALAAGKASLEQGVELNVVADHNPDAHKPGV